MFNLNLWIFQYFIFKFFFSSFRFKANKSEFLVTFQSLSKFGMLHAVSNFLNQIATRKYYHIFEIVQTLT